MWFIVKNLMLFDHFGCLFACWAPESSNFIRLHKVFDQLSWIGQNVVLLTVFDVSLNRRTASTCSEIPNAF